MSNQPSFAFAPADLSAAIGDQAVDESDLRTELATLDDVGVRSVAGHENVRFQTSPGGVGRQRSSGVARARDGEFRRA